jgi:hypothetical protein
LTADNVHCDDCMPNGCQFGPCAEGKMRLCVLSRGLPNCAACPDYACEQLTAFFQSVPHAKANLDALRA